MKQQVTKVTTVVCEAPIDFLLELFLTTAGSTTNTTKKAKLHMPFDLEFFNNYILPQFDEKPTKIVEHEKELMDTPQHDFIKKNIWIYRNKDKGLFTVKQGSAMKATTRSISYEKYNVSNLEDINFITEISTPEQRATMRNPLFM